MMYLILFVAGVLGISLQVVIKLKSLQIKAKRNNLIFKPSSFFTDDWLSLVASFITIGICLLILDEILNLNERIVDYIKWLFIFVGYTGSDIMTRLLGVTNKLLNNAIDYKTTIADTDKETGIVQPPTPIK